MKERVIPFIFCLIYDLIFLLVVLYLIAFKDWSKWTYILCLINGSGLCLFFYKSFEIKEN